MEKIEDGPDKANSRAGCQGIRNEQKGESVKQLTEEKAIKLFKSNEWENWPDDFLVKFQLNQERLCVPFNVFHAAASRIVGQPLQPQSLCRLSGKG